MLVTSFVHRGFDGEIVEVEVDIRRGIPGIDIVGLPDGAVREARERVRVSVRNAGYRFPRERVLINLAPAGVKKEGASFDLPMAVSILFRDGQLPSPFLNGREHGAGHKIMVIGELELSGKVRPVPGVLSAVASGLDAGVERFFVPYENLNEALTVTKNGVYGIQDLTETASIFTLLSQGRELVNENYEQLDGRYRRNCAPAGSQRQFGRPFGEAEDFRIIRGQTFLKRAMEIAAAGRHHIFLFGPPGSGKTLTARAFPSILPDLSREEAVEVTRIHSLGGKLSPEEGLLTRPPVRIPHHTASREGIIGGGKTSLPGEISLAHRGVLFLDEAPEFGKSLLQSLREPIERRRVDIARSGIRYWYPADFQLILAANPCPCGKLGQDESICLCSPLELHGYWKRIGGALLDRIDMRIPVHPIRSEMLLSGEGESSAMIRKRVENVVEIQRGRFKKHEVNWNGEIPVSLLERFCGLDRENKKLLSESSVTLNLSSRATHSVLRLARTVADLENSEVIRKEHIFEALQYRRYGDGDYYWRG